jgi:uncharacterized surface protein with fasciclin (FAS1) repeats
MIKRFIPHALAFGALALFSMGSVSAQCSSSKASAELQETSTPDFGAATASSDAGMIAPVETPAGEMDLVDLAVSVDDLSTLVTAVKAAGLVETLKGKGPFTVFAPTNKAFEALPEGTLEMLLKPENKEKLAAVLTYHVVAGSYPAAKVKDGMTPKTVQGETFEISVYDGGVKVNDARVIKADVMATNGVVHVIDKVILPPSMR